MPRGRPRKTPLPSAPKVNPPKSETVPDPPTTKRGRKATPKEYPICAFCKKEVRDGNLREIKFNQLAGTGEYRFRAINTKPGLCPDCWSRTVRALDNWLIKNGIPEKFTDGRGFREEE